jgi:hypothetical protein
VSDQLPVAGGSGRGVVPATVGGDLTTGGGDGSSVARGEPGRAAAPAATPATQALVSTMDELAGALGLNDRQLQAYRAWAAQNHERLGEALQESTDEQRIAGDATERAECERALHAVWGASYEANVARIKGWLGTLPYHLAEAILQGRYYGGQLLCNDPDVMRALLQASTNSPGHNALDFDRRIAEIHRLMVDMSSEYWKGPRAPEIQAEYRRLVDMQQQRRS